MSDNNGKPLYFGTLSIDEMRETMRGLRQPAPPPEVMQVDPTTGGQKASKPCKLGAVDPVALEEVGKVAGYGQEKYARGNYLKGYPWSWTIDACYRHFLAVQAGEDRDLESGLLHAAHAAWHLLALVSFQLRGLGTDDRFPPVAVPDEVVNGVPLTPFDDGH